MRGMRGINSVTSTAAIRRYGCPEIFNTDQGSQFTAEAFTGTLRSNSIAISMDGKGRWMDNVLIERLWKSVKYEDIYLKVYGSMMVYFSNRPQRQAAA